MSKQIVLARRPKNILIVKPSALGDIIHTLPALECLRHHFPKARISWVVSRGFHHILQGHPHIAHLLIFERQRWAGRGFLKHYHEAISFFRTLRQYRFDLVIDFQGLLRSALITFCTHAPVRIGFENAREGAPWFYTHRVRVPPGERHSVERLALIIQALGLDTARMPTNPPLPLQPNDLGSIRKRLDQHGANLERLVGICPGARWVTKRWPLSHFASLVDQLQSELGLCCVLFGSPAEQELGARIVAQSRHAPIDLIGKTTLKELAAGLQLCHLTITNDSGPMHIAAAVGTPVVALFGPTSPLKTGPFGPGHTVLQLNQFPCIPCFSRQCDHQRCLEELSVSQVLQAVCQQISAIPQLGDHSQGAQACAPR